MLNATMSTVFDEPIGHTDLFILEVKQNRALYLTWREGEFINEIELGMNNTYAESEVAYGPLKLHSCAKAAWITPTTLRVIVRIKETCTARQLDFDFSDEKHIVVRNRSIPDLPNLAAHYVDFSGFPLNKTLDSLIVKAVAPAVLLLGEPDFKIKK